MSHEAQKVAALALLQSAFADTVQIALRGGDERDLTSLRKVCVELWRKEPDKPSAHEVLGDSRHVIARMLLDKMENTLVDRSAINRLIKGADPPLLFCDEVVELSVDELLDAFTQLREAVIESSPNGQITNFYMEDARRAIVSLYCLKSSDMTRYRSLEERILISEQLRELIELIVGTTCHERCSDFILIKTAILRWGNYVLSRVARSITGENDPVLEAKMFQTITSWIPKAIELGIGKDVVGAAMYCSKELRLPFLEGLFSEDNPDQAAQLIFCCLDGTALIELSVAASQNEGLAKRMLLLNGTTWKHRDRRFGASLRIACTPILKEPPSSGFNADYLATSLGDGKSKEAAELMIHLLNLWENPGHDRVDPPVKRLLNTGLPIRHDTLLNALSWTVREEEVAFNAQRDRWLRDKGLTILHEIFETSEDPDVVTHAVMILNAAEKFGGNKSLARIIRERFAALGKLTSMLDVALEKYAL